MKKIGVFIANVGPEVGGGFTFVHEILEEARPTGDPYVPPASLSLRYLEKRRPARAKRPRGIVTSARATHARDARVARHRLQPATSMAFLGKPMSPFLRPDPPIEQMLSAAGLHDVLWHLQPATWLAQDIPYITPVWDLQHRLQPFFPEVAARGEFHYRDNIYAPVLQRASMVITGTEVGSQEIQRFYGVAAERIRILPHPTPGFALANAKREGTPRPAIAPTDPYLFYPAQFWSHKNHANLLEALRLLRLDGLPFSLALSGSDKGNEAFVRETAARLGVADAVKMLGFVSREELVGLYRHAFALAYVTFFGPENLPTLEAFALGCPVVASDVSGARGAARGRSACSSIAAQARRDRHGGAPPPHSSHPCARRSSSLGAPAQAGSAADFVEGVVAWLDEFAPVRRCWPSGGAGPA